MKLKLILLLTFVGLNATIFAQNTSIQEGDDLFKYGMYKGATDAYLKGWPKVKELGEKARIAYRVGVCFYDLKDFNQALTWLNRSIKTDKAPNQVQLYLGRVYQALEKLPEAKEAYAKFAELEPGDTRGKDGVASVDLMIELKENPTRHKVKRDANISSTDDDFNPRFADKKKKSIVFTSNRKEGGSKGMSPINGRAFDNLYMTEMDRKKRFSTPVPFGENINSKFGDADASFDKTGRVMYFNRCEMEKKEVTPCRVYKSEVVGQDWGVATLVEGLVPVDSVDVNIIHPVLSDDGKFLFFSSDIRTSEAYGGYDLWYVKYDKKSDSWSEPINCGPKVNTSGDEVYPYLDKRGAFYFSSNGHPGLGDLDMFVSACNINEQKEYTFEEATNLGYPMNSVADDFGIILFNGDQEKGYFSSNRPGSKGDDIYSFELPPLEFTLIVNVFNAEDKKPIANANLVLIGDGENPTKVEVVTDANGQFTFAENGDERFITSNTNYQLTASKVEDRVLVAKQNISTVGMKDNFTFFMDFPVIIAKEEIKMPEIRYDLGKHKLQINDSVVSPDSLEYLYEILQENPTLKVELMSHTDYRGSDKANQALSERRAKACVCYLAINKKVDASRLTYSGKGETMPASIVDPNNAKDTVKLTEKWIVKQPKALQEHYNQLNRRTNFKVLDWNWKPVKDSAAKEAKMKLEKECKELDYVDVEKLKAAKDPKSKKENENNKNAVRNEKEAIKKP